MENLKINERKTDAVSLLRLTFPSNMAVQTLGHVVCRRHYSLYCSPAFLSIEGGVVPPEDLR